MFVAEFLPLNKTGGKTIKFKFYLILSFFLNISYFSFYAADHSQTNEAILKTVLQNAVRGKGLQIFLSLTSRNFTLH